MQPFTFYTPTKICFGEDSTSGVGDSLLELGARRPLLVTDANLLKTGILAPVLAALKEAGLGDPIIFDQVPPDSDLSSVRNATRIARQAGCDSIIAVGGGSVLDTGKVANIGLTIDGDVLEYEGMNTIDLHLRPMIAVPTTAGTGSEVSAVAMIKDHDDKKKLLFGSRFLFPDVAILDPKLLLSLPPRLTAATGLDALTHAVESFTATTKNSPSDALCLESMRLIFSGLPRATRDGTDLEARAATLVGSMMAGLSFTNAGVGAVHALAHSTGAKFGTHHGLTNAIFLPYGMEFNLKQVMDKFSLAYNCLCSSLYAAGAPVSSWFSLEMPSRDRPELGARALIKAVRGLIAYCQLPARLQDIGVPELNDLDLEELAQAAVTDAAMMFNPREATVEDMIEIIKRAY